MSFSNVEMADMVFVYGLADGNALKAQKEFTVNDIQIAICPKVANPFKVCFIV